MTGAEIIRDAAAAATTMLRTWTWRIAGGVLLFVFRFFLFPVSFFCEV
jgi:hypothetical protein